MLGANVVNNGVCAYFQQRYGAIPRELMELELPQGGFGGSLWESATLAERLHRHFLASPAAFATVSSDVIPWNERLSINFIGLLGRDLPAAGAIAGDDEHELSYEARRRAGKTNAIYPPLVVSHLTFFSQEEGFPVGEMVEAYGKLADAVIGLAAPARDC